MNKTKIEWTDYTWNPVTGCNKISQGCKNCYAETMAKRFWGERKFIDVQLHPKRLKEPIEMGDKIKGKKVFVCDVSDLFHENVPFVFIDLVFAAMAICRDTTFQILTKRIDRAVEWFNYKDRFWSNEGMQGDERIRYQTHHHFGKQIDFESWQWPLENVWIGTSCEDQKAADERIPLLLQTPAVIRFLSCEPLIGAIDLRIADNCMSYNCADFGQCAKCIDRDKLHWVIAGGESTRSARFMHPDWIRSLRDQCAHANIPFFFKQWGEYLPLEFDAQPPFRSFASTTNLIDGHSINVIDPQDPLGKPGKYMGRSFVDAMEAIMFCTEEKVSHCDFLRQGGNKKFKPTLDGRFHREFPNQVPQES